MARFLFNDVPASVYGLVIGDVTGWLDSPNTQTPTVTVPPRAGTVQISDTREQPRAITMRGYVRGSSASDARTRYENLKAALRTSRVKLSMPDGRNRHINAVRDSLIAPSIGGQFIQRNLPVELRFTALDPYFYDDSLTSVAAPNPLPLGTAPVRPVLTLTGATVTGPVFTLRDFNDVIVAQMTFAALALSPGDTLIVDCDAMTAKKNGTNVLSNLIGDFFKIDPTIHADRANTDWPYITVNATGLTTSYRKAWE